MNTTLKRFSPLVARAAVAVVAGFDIAGMVSAATTAVVPQSQPKKADDIVGSRIRLNKDIVGIPAGEYGIVSKVKIYYKIAKVRKDGTGLIKATVSVLCEVLENAVADKSIEIV